jgi:hypothetical protein
VRRFVCLYTGMAAASHVQYQVPQQQGLWHVWLGVRVGVGVRGAVRGGELIFVPPRRHALRVRVCVCVCCASRGAGYAKSALAGTSGLAGWLLAVRYALGSEMGPGAARARAHPRCYHHATTHVCCRHGCSKGQQMGEARR